MNRRDRLAEFLLAPATRIPRLAAPELAHLTRLVHGRFTGWFYQCRYNLVAELLESVDTALEVGYGSGLFAVTLARAARRVVGIDLHNEAQLVKEYLASLGLEFPALHQATVLNLPFRDNSFDIVVAISVLEHIPDLDAAFGEITRVCKPGGAVLLGFPVKNAITRLALRFLGYDDTVIHPSGHKEILATVQKYLVLEKALRFPRLLPVDQSLYLAVRLRRTRAG